MVAKDNSNFSSIQSSITSKAFLKTLQPDLGIQHKIKYIFIIKPTFSKYTDPGGYWWPPTYSTWTPTIASFSFSVSAQFTIFSSFSGPELPEPF
jgi:hypothetical protein